MTRNRLQRGALVTSLTAILTLSACGTSIPDAPRLDDEAAIASESQASHAHIELPTASSVAGLVEQVSPAVVNITIARRAQPSPFGMFQLPGMPQMPNRRGPTKGAGSGFIVDPSGYIVTNAHVVDGAEEVTVRLQDERELEARVVGKDERLDLALLKVDGAKGLTAVRLGDSEKLRVGEHVLAVGNPYGLGHTVTLGIVSAKARAIGAGPYDDFIQTDASINPGNSGGPLFDLHGRVVGINTAVRQGADGIGFAIPIDDLKGVLDQLRQHGYVERGRLGLRYQRVTHGIAKALGLGSAKGALVSEVEEGSPADDAGIREGDVILEVDGEVIDRANELARRIGTHRPGDEVDIELFRDGKTLEVTAELGALDGDVAGPPVAKPAGPTDILGLTVTDSPEGVRITGVEAQHDNLKPGDVILSADHQKVTSVAALKRVVEASKREAILLEIRRGDVELFAALER